MMSGNPTCLAKATISSTDDAAVDCAQGMPCCRKASFIDGLSRHNHEVRTDVPSMPSASRTLAVDMMCASTVVSSLSMRTLS